MDNGPRTKDQKMRNFKKIEAWLLASDLAVAIYGQTGKFPKEERYGLISQVRRSAISVLANIAEGAGRQHKKDYLNFLYIARGSLSETESLLEISARLHYLGEPHLKQLIEFCHKTAKCLYGLIRAVESEVHGPLSMVLGPNNKGGINA
ncbi:MAG: four helix bundle protein [Deltaproteobacteria bacterium]|nr:four helix bundle protein [Deltaproteobacteria bacterium]